MNQSTLTLIPAPLHVDALSTINSAIADAILQCDVVYAEQLRTARRFFKALIPSIVIDDKEWVEVGKNEATLKAVFLKHIRQGRRIGVVSEAGCPGIADPGQLLAAWAHESGIQVLPLVGPNSMLLALMASGLNGQQYCFNGYLPIDSTQRIAQLKNLQAEVLTNNVTQLFMETPYRNEQLLSLLLKTLTSEILLCIAADLTAPTQFIATRPVAEWRKNNLPNLHKRPCIFLIGRRLAI